jgi:hypothetical protein
MDKLTRIKAELIAQEVKSDLVGRGINNVTCVGLSAFFSGHALVYIAHRKSQRSVDLAHPVGVAFGQVIIGSEHVHSAVGNRVHEDGGNGRKGFAFPGLHLGDFPLRHHERAEELDIEQTQAENSFRHFGSQRHRFYCQVLREGLASQILRNRLQPRVLFSSQKNATVVDLIQYCLI